MKVKGLLNISLLLLALFISSSISANIQDGLFGIKLGDILSDVDEEDSFKDAYGDKYFILNKNIFSDQEDAVILHVTPKSNMVYSIRFQVMFNNSSEAMQFYRDYMEYFRWQYPNSDYNFLNIKMHRGYTYRIDGSYLLTIMIGERFKPSVYWLDRLGNDYFDIEKEIEPRFDEKSSDEQERLKGLYERRQIENTPFEHLRIVTLMLEYVRDSDEYKEIRSIINDEIGQINLEDAKGRGFVIP